MVVKAGVNSMLYPVCQGVTSFTIPLKTIPANQPIPLDYISRQYSTAATTPCTSVRNRKITLARVCASARRLRPQPR